MPIKIGNEYFKVTNAWNGKLLVAALLLGVIFPKLKIVKYRLQKPTNQAKYLLIKRVPLVVEFASGA